MSKWPVTDAHQARICDESERIIAAGGNPDSPERLNQCIQAAYDLARAFESEVIRLRDRSHDFAISDLDARRYRAIFELEGIGLIYQPPFVGTKMRFLDTKTAADFVLTEKASEL